MTIAPTAPLAECSFAIGRRSPGVANSSTISSIVRRALKRAGVKAAHTGAHVLRHSLSDRALLRRGSSLDEIRRVAAAPKPEHHGDLRQGGCPRRCIHSHCGGREALDQPDSERPIRDYLAHATQAGVQADRSTKPRCWILLSFLAQRRSDHITVRLALDWATRNKHQRPDEWAARLTIVRGFARHWSGMDPLTEIPPVALLPYRPQRARPYIYSDV